MEKSGEALNKLISLMPFDRAQESIRRAHHERNQPLAVRPFDTLTTLPELVEGLVQGFPGSICVGMDVHKDSPHFLRRPPIPHQRGISANTPQPRYSRV
jgi:hypothetical protein